MWARAVGGYCHHLDVLYADFPRTGTGALPASGAARGSRLGPIGPLQGRVADLRKLGAAARYRRRVSSGPPGNGWSTLSANGQRARYGVSYLRNVCAQGAVGLNETPADEDVLAVDCDVVFPEGNVRVQVKCTSGLTLDGKTKSWRLKPEWVNKWSRSKVPVYFVIVIVPKTESTWLTHTADGTLHRTAAFWQRVSSESTKSISIPKAQRLTAATLQLWHDDFLASYTSKANVS